MRFGRDHPRVGWPSRERTQQLVAGRERASDDAVVVGVDRDVVGVPDLDPREAGCAAPAERLIEGAYATRAQAMTEGVLREPGLNADVRDQLR